MSPWHQPPSHSPSWFSASPHLGPFTPACPPLPPPTLTVLGAEYLEVIPSPSGDHVSLLHARSTAGAVTCAIGPPPLHPQQWGARAQKPRPHTIKAPGVLPCACLHPQHIPSCPECAFGMGLPISIIPTPSVVRESLEGTPKHRAEVAAAEVRGGGAW